MRTDTPKKIEVVKSYDTERSRWVVTYTEHFLGKNEKEEWQWSSSTSELVPDENSADVRKVNMEKTKVVREKELNIRKNG